MPAFPPSTWPNFQPPPTVPTRPCHGKRWTEQQEEVVMAKRKSIERATSKRVATKFTTKADEE